MPRSTNGGHRAQDRADDTAINPVPGRVTGDIKLPRPRVPVRNDGSDPGVVNRVPHLNRPANILLKHGPEGPMEDVAGRRREGGGDVLGVRGKLADVPARPRLDCVYIR